MADRWRPPAKNPRSVYLKVRLTKNERSSIEEATKRTGQSLSDWCRAALARAARLG